MFHPARHVRMIASRDDVIVLDLAADRYLGLPGAIDEAGIPVAIGDAVARLDPAAATALVEAGLIVAAEDTVPAASIILPSRAINRDNPGSASASLRDLVDLVAALVSVGWRLWRGQPCRHQQIARTGIAEPADLDRLNSLLSRLRLLRLVVPTPRRCLPSALLTALWLRRKGIGCEIVSGVRTHPFEAHCWAEHDGIVLDDDLDRLRSYTPIAVARP